MATDPVEILNRRNAEVAKIRGYQDLTEEAKQRMIQEVNEKARAEYTEAREAAARERNARLQKSKAAVFRVPVPFNATEAEKAQIYASYRSAFNDVLAYTSWMEDPEETAQELERILGQAERTGDALLARAAYHRAIDLGTQSVVDAYLSPRPNEDKAWESYTEAHAEVNQASDVGALLEHNLMSQTLGSDGGNAA